MGIQVPLREFMPVKIEDPITIKDYNSVVDFGGEGVLSEEFLIKDYLDFNNPDKPFIIRNIPENIVVEFELLSELETKINIMPSYSGKLPERGFTNVIAPGTPQKYPHMWNSDFYFYFSHGEYDALAGMDLNSIDIKILIRLSKITKRSVLDRPLHHPEVDHNWDAVDSMYSQSYNNFLNAVSAVSIYRVIQTQITQFDQFHLELDFIRESLDYIPITSQRSNLLDFLQLDVFNKFQVDIHLNQNISYGTLNPPKITTRTFSAEFSLRVLNFSNVPGYYNNTISKCDIDFDVIKDFNYPGNNDCPFQLFIGGELQGTFNIPTGPSRNIVHASLIRVENYSSLTDLFIPDKPIDLTYSFRKVGTTSRDTLQQYTITSTYINSHLSGYYEDQVEDV